MLVLSRKPGEKLLLKRGNVTVEVVVVDVRGNRVRLGVEAPKDMRIARAELKPLTEVVGVPFEA
jgi:carbon storage regulator